MITLFVIGMAVFMFNAVIFCIKAAWGITKGILFVMFLPLILIGMVFAGLFQLALPLVVVAMIVSMIMNAGSHAA